MDLRIINLRAIAILIVVLGHSIILYDPSWGLYHSDIVMPLFEFVKQHLINPIQMPIFFFISGFLFYRSVNERAQLSFGKFFRSKFFRLIIPYYSIAILWMNPIKLCVKSPGYEDGFGFSDIARQLLFSGHLGHLWYLPTLLGCFFIVFLSVSVLYKYIARGCYTYFISLLFALFLCIHLFSNHISSFFCLSYIAHYLVFFFAGYCFYYGLLVFHTILTRKETKYLCIIGLVFSSVFVFCFSEILRPLCIVLLLIGAYMIIPNKTNTISRSISDKSFGIYLFHSPFIYLTFTYFANLNPWLVLLINFVLFGGLSYLISILISKSNFKYIIGAK